MDYWIVAYKVLEIFFNCFQLLYWYLEAFFRFFVPPPMKSIDGEIILVTGAAGGIGSALCRYIVKCGTNIKLVMWDINTKGLHKLADELKMGGRTDLEIFCYVIDISSRENIDSCCNSVKSKVGPVTIIFNNAGIAPQGNFLQLTNQQVEKTIQVNLMSHFWIIRQFLPEMVRGNHGRIINICSVAGFYGGRNMSAYCASKFGVNGYTEALKTELAHFNCNGIHCTTVYPVAVQTPMISSLIVDKNKTSMLASIVQNFMRPEDVAVKIVDGMRREYEYIYLPSIIPLIRFREFLTPNKYNKLVLRSYADTFTFKVAEEEKRFRTPLVPVTTEMA